MKISTYIISILLLFFSFFIEQKNLFAQELNLSETHTDVTCFGKNNGTITATATGGLPPYTFYLNNINMGETSSFQELFAKKYILKVVDSNNADETIEVVINQPIELEIEGSTKDIHNCYGDETGRITINGKGGVFPYQYSINDGGNWTTNGNFENLLAGNYIVVLKDNNLCITKMNIKLNQPPLLELTGTVQNVKTCYGDSTGGLNIQAKGGTQPYEYSLDNAIYQEDGFFEELPSAYYTVYIRDKQFCKTQQMFVITQPHYLGIETIDKIDIKNCFGDTTGILTVNVGGGMQPYLYSLDGINFKESNEFKNLKAGNHTITVKDSYNCLTNSDAKITQPRKLKNDSVVINNLTCKNKGDGKIEIYTSGGIPFYLYSFNNGESFDISNTKPWISAGEYFLKIKDSKNCILFDTVIVTEPDAVNPNAIFNDITCKDANDGSIVFETTGGIPPYFYSTNEGYTYTENNSFHNLLPNEYKIYLKDNNNCFQILSFNVTQPPSMNSATTESEDILCNGQNTGKLIVHVSGGEAPYSYSCNNGENFQEDSVFSSLNAGNYQIVAKDARNCQKTTEAIINQPEKLKLETNNLNDIICHGETNGSVKLVGNGGSGILKYSINQGNTFSENGVFENLEEGSYIGIVLDTNNCNAAKTFSISEPDTFMIEFENSPITCYNENNGKIVINAQGGTTPYFYSKDGGYSFQENNIFENLAPQNFQIVIKDANNCTVNEEVNLESPDAILFTVEAFNDITCHGANNGQIILKGSGGSGNLQYSINDGLTFSENYTFPNLSGGEYKLQIKDENNCEKNLTQIINEPLDISINDLQQQNVNTCFGDNTGQIVISALGGVLPLKYSIDNEATFQTNGTFQNLYANNYNIIIKDKNNCKKDIEANISQPIELLIDTVENTPVSTCFGDSTATLLVKANGGTPPLNYSINSGNTFQQQAFFSNIPSKKYYVIVKDANGCTKLSNDTISQPPRISSEVYKNQVTCNGENNGAITIDAIGGTGNFLYSIDNGASFHENNYFDNLTPKEYDIIVKDEKNCNKKSPKIQIIEPPELKIDSVKTNTVRCDKVKEGTIIIQASGGLGLLHYSLNDSIEQYDNEFTGLSAGKYTIKVRDENLCTVTTETEIKSSGTLCLDIPNVFTPNGDGTNDTWEIKNMNLYPEAQILIYDRNGRLVASYKGDEDSWNGTYNGNPMPLGTYWYFINLYNNSEGIKGYFTLIR